MARLTEFSTGRPKTVSTSSFVLCILLGLQHPLISLVTSDVTPINLQVDQNLHFVPGTYAEYLEDPVFYDTYLPLVYQFQVPKHMENAMKIMWSHATVCNESDSRYQGKLCPVVHHLHKVVANLSQDMGFWKDFIPHEISDDQTLSKSSISKKSSSISSPSPPNCADISPHFRSHFTPKDKLTSYLKSLEACPLGQSLTPPVSPYPDNWIIDKQIYYTMVDRFYSEFYRSLPGTGNVDWVVTLNSYVSIQGILLSNNYMESNRVMQAFLQCQNRKIPQSFLKKEVLRASLKKNALKVSNLHYKYLWDPDKGDEGVLPYYTLPITDCTFTDDYKLIVRLLIPVKIPDVDTKLIQIRTFPFMEKIERAPPSHVAGSEDDIYKLPQLCKLRTPSTLRMIESSSGLLFENSQNCEPNKLCRRIDLNSFIPLDPCTSGILTNNETTIKRECQLNCFPIDQRLLPVFQRVSSDTFLAVGTSQDKIFIQCNGQPLEKLTLVNLGGLEIKLTCNCQISYRGMILQPQKPCQETDLDMPKVRHVLPLHWNDFGKNLSENEVTRELEEKAWEKFKYKIELPENPEKSGKSDNHHPVEADKQIYVEHTSGSSEGSGYTVQLCFLWIFVLVLIGTNVWLTYQVYMLLRWRKIQDYKDTRIVYSVPPSPQFPNKF